MSTASSRSTSSAAACWVWGVRCGVWGVGFGVWGLGCRVYPTRGFGFRVGGLPSALRPRVPHDSLPTKHSLRPACPAIRDKFDVISFGAKKKFVRGLVWGYFNFASFGASCISSDLGLD